MFTKQLFYNRFLYSMNVIPDVICNSTARISEVSFSYSALYLFSKYRCHDQHSNCKKGKLVLTNFCVLLCFLNPLFFQMTGYKMVTDVVVFMILYPHVHLDFLTGLLYKLDGFLSSSFLTHVLLIALNVGDNVKE